MPPARMRGDGRKAKDPKKTLLRLLTYLKKHIPTLAIVMMCIPLILPRWGSLNALQKMRKILTNHFREIEMLLSIKTQFDTTNQDLVQKRSWIIFTRRRKVFTNP